MATPAKQLDLKTAPVKTLVKSATIKKKFEDVLGKKAPQFISSLVAVVNSNYSLKKVDQSSVIASALVAASLDLPINQNFGYMYLVPYKGKAQPQMGYKGYIQLAQRSGMYKHLNAISVYEDEFRGWNPLTEELLYEPDFHDRDDSEQPVGYVGHFELLNGFEKTTYWSHEQIDRHRQKFSKMSGKQKPSGVWETDFDAMALKTVLRNLIGKWGPMTVDMQTAYNTDEEVDQSTAVDDEPTDVANDEPATDVSQLIQVGGDQDADSEQNQEPAKESDKQEELPFD